ncbi:MAG TPA: MFS transporter, partial [Bryobacteraceae bacterium]
LETHSWSPLAARFQPNKDELWLHWTLVEAPRSRLAILQRRLLPGRVPEALEAPHVPDAKVTREVRVRRKWRRVAFVASRFAHHLRALPSVGASAVRWFGSGIGLEASYWKFFLAAGLFNLGLYIFFLLYNLYLLKLGFRENTVGLMSSAMTAGSVAGCLPVALAIRRFGIRNTLLICFSLIASLSALRAWVTPVPLLIGLAFIGGMVSSSWAVCISPAVAQLTNERNRAFGFSLIFSAGIGIGILGGLAGGNLPGLVSRLHLASSEVGSYRASLLVGCVLVLLALWPLSRLRTNPAAPPAEQRLYPSRSSILPFLLAMAVWNVGTGLFNPFFNVFFARMRVPVEKIGVLYSAAHLAQAAMVLVAPLVLRRFGLTRGISGMQLSTALAMFCLAGAQGPVWAGLAFAMFTASQYMSEPGLYTYLMDSVAPSERGGASALNFIVAFSVQAAAAALSGALLARVGYAPVLVAGSFICATAAVLFRVLLEEPKPHPASVS